MDYRHAQGIASTTATSIFTASVQPDYASSAASSDEETLRKLQQNVGEIRMMIAQVEKAKASEETKQVDLDNQLNMLRATINELSDAINKSKRREVELIKQIDSWVELIKNHKQTVGSEDARFQSVSEESEQLCNDLEFNIDLLKQKRMSVDGLVLVLAQTRKYHDEFVKQLRDDLRSQKNELETWDKRAVANKQPLIRLQERHTTASNELVESKARLAENQAACAALNTPLDSAYRVGAVSNISQTAPQIVQDTPTPVHPSPMKAQTMSLVPVLIQNKKGSEISIAISGEKKSDSNITSQLREVLQKRHSNTNLAQKNPSDFETPKSKLEQVQPRLTKKPSQVNLSASRVDLLECLDHVCDPVEPSVLKEEKPRQKPLLILDKNHVDDLAERILAARK